MTGLKAFLGMTICTVGQPVIEAAKSADANWIEKLATASGQFVLSAVTVALTAAVIYQYQSGRKERDRREDKLIELIENNTKEKAASTEVNRRLIQVIDECHLRGALR